MVESTIVIIAAAPGLHEAVGLGLLLDPREVSLLLLLLLLLLVRRRRWELARIQGAVNRRLNLQNEQKRFIRNCCIFTRTTINNDIGHNLEM